MKTNESILDRIIRAVVGVIFLALYFTGAVTGAIGIILLVLGGILLLTGIVGFCPLYALLKIKTVKA
jgi:hypothetical protein